MSDVITDSHYTQRDRHGRHITWLARLLTDAGLQRVRGIGIDEKTALCIDESGLGTVMGANSVYFLSSNEQHPEQCTTRKPLSWKGNSKPIEVYKIDGSPSGNGSFDARSWSLSGGSSFYYSVDNGVIHIAR